MRLSKTMLHPYSKHRFYLQCTFKLRTYHAMLTTSTQNIQEDDIEVMRDKMTSMRSIWHMAEHKEMIHISGVWPDLAHPHPCLQDSKTGINKHEFQTLGMCSPWIKRDTMAPVNTKYGMRTFMTCPHP